VKKVCILFFVAVLWLKPLAQNNLTSSNLPIVVINTGGVAIPDEPKIMATMGIINNGPGLINQLTDPFNEYFGPIGIEERGSSSAIFPQKSYSLETRWPDSSNQNVSLFGWPSDNDWILHAPYTDKSLMRNVLTYKIGNELGRWAPRTQFCEVILNGNYVGVYVFMERIKTSSGRVNIPGLDYADTLNDQITGGYIVKVDKTTGGSQIAWNSPYGAQVPGNGVIGFQLHDPEYDTIHPLQKAYIQDYITDWEQALKSTAFTHPIVGYKPFIDVRSFIDYFLVTELSKNVDGYRISTFLHKQHSSQGGKLIAGPFWDYNIAWGNANYCEGNLTTGWEINFNSICGGSWQNPFWWNRMLDDPLFANEVQCRWTELRSTILSNNALSTFIDSIGSQLTLPAERHFQQWPILGTYVWPNQYIGQTYQQELGYLKNWVLSRATWMDNNMFGTCTANSKEMMNSLISIVPNPTQNEILVTGIKDIGEIIILDLSGKIVHRVPFDSDNIRIELQQFQNGVYFLTEPRLGIYEKVIKN
jgi:predicted Rdx family selenoprotein